MDQRAKGEDVNLTMFELVNGQRKPIDAIVDIKSYECTFQIELLTEGYLGQNTNRLDEIFRGVRGSIELHFSDRATLKLVQSVVNRARRRSGASAGPRVEISHHATLFLPDGTRPIISVPSMFFGDIPLSFAGREQYGTLKLDWSGEDAQFIGLG